MAAASASATDERIGLRAGHRSSTCSARSAPRASASRNTCVTRGGPGRHGDHLAAVRLAQPQRGLERVGVGLVHLEVGVGVANPGARLVGTHLPVAGDDLLDADSNLHEFDAGRARSPNAPHESSGPGPARVVLTTVAVRRLSGRSGSGP